MRWLLMKIVEALREFETKFPEQAAKASGEVCFRET